MLDLLKSRKFWAVVVGLVVTYLLRLFPNFNLDQEATVSFLVLLASYIVGTALDPGVGWHGLLTSRKFYAAIVGLGITVLQGFGVQLPAEIPADTVTYILYLLSTYIAGVAIRDFRANPNPPKPYGL